MIFNGYNVNWQFMIQYQEFPNLTDEMKRVVEEAKRASEGEILVSEFKINITRDDVKTLEDSNWLNDDIIDFYMEVYY